MQSAYIVMGTLTDADTIRLDEALPLARAKVRVVVEPVAAAGRRPYATVIAEIRDRQRARGHQPPTREAVDAYLRAERAAWEE